MSITTIIMSMTFFIIIIVIIVIGICFRIAILDATTIGLHRYGYNAADDAHCPFLARGGGLGFGQGGS